MARVVLENIVKEYAGGVVAVRGVSLEIDREEFVVLVGPSGCGKTTTLRMVAGLEDITSGTIRIGDRVVNNIAPKDRDIAMVFQNYALYPHMTVYKNLAFALKLRKVPRAEIEKRVRWAAALLGIEQLLNRRPKQLSGGQRQRVAVGRAIVRQPQVFLFDEPLSNLDAKLRVTTRAELKRLQQQLKTTTVYVTHDQEEAMTLGDRVVVMNQGRIHQCGSPLDIYRRPGDRFVAGFVGMPPMNFVSGRLSQDHGALEFHGPGIRFAVPPGHRERLQKHVDKPVVLGVRPESFQLPEGAANGMATVPTTVDVVEILGAMMDLFVRTAEDQALVCRVATTPLQAGSKIALVLDPDAVHIFEPDVAGTDPAEPTRYGQNLTC